MENLETRFAPAFVRVINLNDAGPGSLRDAITFVNASTDASSTIQIDSSLSGRITLKSALDSLKKNITIVDYAFGSVGVERDTTKLAFAIFKVDNGTSCEIDGLYIADGSDPNGGGVQNQGNLGMQYDVVEYNTGGGIVNGAGLLHLYECSIYGNTRAGADGGGIDNLGSATIIDSEIFANSAQRGGGIANDSNIATMDIGNSDVYSNTASVDGGGIWVQGKVTMGSGSLTYNQAVNGGGIYVDSTTPNSVTMTGVAIKNNNGTTAGGGFYLEAGSLTLNSITITGNTSPLGPGGVWRKPPASTLTINNPVLITDAIVQIN